MSEQWEWKHEAKLVSALFTGVVGTGKTSPSLIVLTEDATIHVHNSEMGGAPYRTIDSGSNVHGISMALAGGHLAALRSSDKHGNLIHVWRIASDFEEINEYQAAELCMWALGSTSGLALSPDGMQLALIPRREINSGDVELHPVATAKAGADLPSPFELPSATNSAVGSISYSSDGALLAVAHQNSEVEIFDLASRSPLRLVFKNMSDGACCFFSPASDVLAVAGTNCGFWTIFDVKPPRVERYLAIDYGVEGWKTVAACHDYIAMVTKTEARPGQKGSEAAAMTCKVIVKHRSLALAGQRTV